MQWISKGNILIVGLGLMGGSYARALSRLGYHVAAVDTREKSIEYALREGIIEEGDISVSSYLVSEADAVIFGLYPNVFKEWIAEHQQMFRPGTMITHQLCRHGLQGGHRDRGGLAEGHARGAEAPENL